MVRIHCTKERCPSLGPARAPEPPRQVGANLSSKQLVNGAQKLVFSNC